MTSINLNSNFTKEKMNEILNWTLPGLQMFYRDSELSKDVFSKYEIGQIIRSNVFVDVSDFAGKLIKNCRFIIATNKAAPLYQINPNTSKWRLHTININSYYKILDIYKKGEKTQLLLLHIPAKGINFFSKSEIYLEGNNFEKLCIEKARMSFDKKMEMKLIPELEEDEWINRTNLPIGLDASNDFSPLSPIKELSPEVIKIYNAIFKLTEDTDLNKWI